MNNLAILLLIGSLLNFFPNGFYWMVLAGFAVYAGHMVLSLAPGGEWCKAHGNWRPKGHLKRCNKLYNETLQAKLYSNYPGRRRDD